MDELFPPKPVELTWKPAASRPAPAIFLRELVLLETVIPYDPVQEVPFQPGLNIVWADPKTASAKKGGSRLAGHSAGKSTFCRIIRWLLGESRFGKEDLQSAIGTNFSKGIAALHLEVNGASWIVGRAFWDSKEHWAVQANSVKEALASGIPNKHDLEGFIKDLETATIEPLIRHNLPGVADKLVPTDLLAWLTRDQECALQTVEAWRDTPSPSAKNIAAKESRHILMRLVLELLDEEEWKEMVICAGLEASKAAENKKKPDFEASAYASCEPLRFIVPKDGRSLNGELLISKAEAQVSKRKEKLETLNAGLEALKLPEMELHYQEALTAFVKKEQEISTTKRTIKGLEKKIAERDGDALIAAQRRIDQDREIPPGYCARKKEEVDGLCKYFQETPEHLATHRAASEITKARDHLQEQLNDTLEFLGQLEEQQPFPKERENALRLALERAKTSANELRNEIATCAAELKTAGSIITIAREAFQSWDTSVREIKDLTKKIKKSNDRQTAIRKDRWRDRTDFGELFQSVVRFLMGEDATGFVNFDSDGLFALTAKTRTTLSSAAIDALTVIAFDLAAMFWSASGRGHHPRFLLHDSPRVADMSPVPYAAIFEAVKAAEQLGQDPPNFQYIITTTEAPPDELKKDHLILGLDASTPAGRLFKRDL